MRAVKFLLPLALALILAACSTPEDKEAAHQRQLHEEARANFMAMKARERKSGAPMAARTGVPAAAPLPSSRPEPRVKAPRSSEPKRKPRNDETIYYWNVPSR